MDREADGSGQFHPHLSNDMLARVGDSCHPEDKPDIDGDGATVIGIPSKVIDRGFEGAVKVDPYQLPSRIEDGASRIAAVVSVS